jgi:hypothetical protein
MRITEAQIGLFLIFGPVVGGMVYAIVDETKWGRQLIDRAKDSDFWCAYFLCLGCLLVGAGLYPFAWGATAGLFYGFYLVDTYGLSPAVIIPSILLGNLVWVCLGLAVTGLSEKT